MRLPLLPLLALLAVLLPHAVQAGPLDHGKLRVLLDTRSSLSDGAQTLDELATLAEQRGADVLVLTDHDRYAIRAAIPGFEELLGWTVEKPSINAMGADRYLEGIAEVGRRHPKLLIIPGAESAPFYWWSLENGSRPTVHDWERHLMTIGYTRPEQIADLPVAGNHASTRTVGVLWWHPIPGLMLLVLGMWLRARLSRHLGTIFVAMGLVAMLGNQPFRPIPESMFDDQAGWIPYQRVIDASRNQGIPIFWNHPYTNSGVRSEGPVDVHTPPYPEALMQTFGYTGYSVVYGDTDPTVEPGGSWDLLNLAYLAGTRSAPVWGVAIGDFHADGESNELLGNFPTLVEAQPNMESVVSALASGKMVAISCDAKQPISAWATLQDLEGMKEAGPGQWLKSLGVPEVDGWIERLVPEQSPLPAMLVVNGRVAARWLQEVPGPFHVALPEDVDRGFARVVIGSGREIVRTNPIFFERISP